MFSNNFLNCFLSCSSKMRSLELHDAIRADDFTLLKQLVDDDILDINYDAGFYGTVYYGTPLVQAIIQNKVKCFRYLVEHGASLRKFDSRKAASASILHVAAQYGSLEVVQYLLEECDMKVNNNLPTPMDLACSTGELEVVRYLVEKQGYYQGRSLHEAAYNGHLDVLEYCIDQGANLERTIGQDGATPLHCASAAPCTDPTIATLKALLHHGANPLALMPQGHTTLHLARSAAVASHLVERDYWMARNGHQQVDTTAAHEFLCTRNEFGEDALATIQKEIRLLKCEDGAEHDHETSPNQPLEEMNKLADYVEGWTCSRSFVPSDEPADDNLSVMPNPNLGEFQQRLVGSVHQHLEQTAIGEVACVVLGYLAPADLLNGWEGWEMPAKEQQVDKDSTSKL